MKGVSGHVLSSLRYCLNGLVLAENGVSHDKTDGSKTGGGGNWKLTLSQQANDWYRCGPFRWVRLLNT